MIEHGFTPGPWRVMGDNCPECWMVEDSEGYFIAQCEDRRGFSTLDAVGNARLIAASPTLLEALEQVRHSIKQAMIPGNDWRRELQLIANTADAAITLTTGRGA